VRPVDYGGLRLSVYYRVPETASIHDKSYYTSNKDHLYRALDDISLHVQASKPAELAHAASEYLQQLQLATNAPKLTIFLLPSPREIQGPLSQGDPDIIIRIMDPHYAR
jgi:hypothetical protein